MKVITILILFTVISIINSSLNGFTSKSCNERQGTEESTQAFSKDFCRTLKVSDSSNRCCFMKYKIDNKTYYNCIEVTQAEFQDIDQKIRDLEAGLTEYNIDIKSLECSSSSYLFGSLLLFLVFLF